MYSLNLTPSLIGFDINDIEINSNSFYEKFRELENIEEEDKIAIWDNKIYRENVYYGQSLWRKIVRQSRIFTKEFIIKEFNDYTKLLDMMRQAEIQIPMNDKRYFELLSIMRNNNNLIKKIKRGLINTKNLYKDDEINNLNEIINKILDNFNIYETAFAGIEQVYSNRSNCDSPPVYSISDLESLDILKQGIYSDKSVFKRPASN